jgi:uncharacterized delta-60 repeat protein
MPRFNRSRAFQVRTSIVILFISSLFSPLPSAVQATGGDLDPTFGIGGKVTTDLNFGDVGRAMVLQPDGKIVVAGTTGGNGTDFALARYNTNGSLDPSFGTGGWTSTDFNGLFDGVRGIALQTDGKIVAAGVTTNGTISDFAMARYNPNGSLDASFGTAGKVITDFLGGIDDVGAVLLQTDGKIVVVGAAFAGYTESFNFALARYDTYGNLDPSFGSGGKVSTDFGGAETGLGAALQQDGKIVVVGVSGLGFVVARYNIDGSPDSGFGSGGQVVTTFASGEGVAYSVVIQSDHKILAAGYSGFYDFTLVRYGSSGNLDSSFGSGGIVITDFYGGSDNGFAVALQTDGKAIVAGSAAPRFGSSDFALARYDTSGNLDPSFGTNGKVTTDFSGSEDQASAIAIQSDGKIVLAGAAYQDSCCGFFNFALARYNGASFDICLQDDSNGNLLQFGSTTGDYQFTNCGGLTLGGRGVVTRRGSTITLQQNGPDRRILATFNGAVNRGTASIQVLSSGARFTITDRNTLNNTCTCATTHNGVGGPR